jgi:hypothetical protein
VTASALLDRPMDVGPAARLIVAVVDLGYPAEPVLAQVALTAQPFVCRVKPVVLAPRIGFSTDAALVARAHQRVQDEYDDVLAALWRQVPHLVEPADFVWYPWSPVGGPVMKARRAARRATRAYRAHEVILPPHLRDGVGDESTA